MCVCKVCGALERVRECERGGGKIACYLLLARGNAMCRGRADALRPQFPRSGTDGKKSCVVLDMDLVLDIMETCVRYSDDAVFALMEQRCST
jgi:hypothetical protein